MWKPTRKEEEAAPVRPALATIPKEARPVESPKASIDTRSEVAHIGKSVLVKGELSGSEDLYLDGEVEGSVELKGHGLTIGPHGRVRAHTQAREVVVHGKIEGNVNAERVELKRSAMVMGDIVTQRVMIEDGAYFKGSIEVRREQKPEAKPMAAAAAASASPGATANASLAQPSLLEPKR